MRFELEQRINGYVEVEGTYQSVTVKQTYNCKTYDDLQNLFLTLVDFSDKALDFSVRKIKEEGDE